MTNKKAPSIRCGTHGKRTAAVVCGHLVGDTDTVRGFVENSSEPDDLQAWCDECERLFVQEGEMTPTFKRFTRMAVVCDVCYVRIREKHSKIE